MIVGDLPQFTAVSIGWHEDVNDARGDIEQAMVMKWESGELFPTKKHCDQMEELRAKGPAAIPKKAKGNAPSPMKVLADPSAWELFRKIVAHKKLRDEVIKLAASYADPAEDEPAKV